MSAVPRAVDSPGPWRGRRDLVPLGGDPYPLHAGQGEPSQSWFLGATGEVAHLPCAPDIEPRGSLRLSAIGAPDQQSRCRVFLTQVPAGWSVPRCEDCRRLHDEHTPPASSADA